MVGSQHCICIPVGVGVGSGKLEPKFFIINILIQNLYLSGIPVCVMVGFWSLLPPLPFLPTNLNSVKRNTVPRYIGNQYWDISSVIERTLKINNRKCFTKHRSIKNNYSRILQDVQLRVTFSVTFQCNMNETNVLPTKLKLLGLGGGSTTEQTPKTERAESHNNIFWT